MRSSGVIYPGLTYIDYLKYCFNSFYLKKKVLTLKFVILQLSHVFLSRILHITLYFCPITKKKKNYIIHHHLKTSIHILGS